MGKFRSYLNSIGLHEEDVGTGSGDVASFTGKLDMVKRNKYLDKGKKCQKTRYEKLSKNAKMN